MNDFDFQIALFDMDGTLLDSMKYWESVVFDFLLQEKIKCPENLWEIVRSMTMAESAVFLKTHFCPHKSEKEIIDSCNKIIEENYRYRIEAKKGVLPYLKQLKNRSIPLFICTSTDDYLVELVMNRLGLTDWFEAIFTCSQVCSSKSSSPEVYDAALSYLEKKGWKDREGNPPTRKIAAVFEDAGFAAKTAFEAGFQVIGVYDEVSKGDEAIVRKNSNHFIYSFEELL